MTKMEEIRKAITRLEEHAQYCLGAKDLHALDVLIEYTEEQLENDANI